MIPPSVVHVKIFAKVPYLQHYYDTDVWTRGVWVWIGVDAMVVRTSG